VKNRTAYNEIVTELDLAIELGDCEPFAIVVADINGLKKTNDRYGHEIGNRLIVKAAKIICDVFKHSPVYRIGGDEFMVLMRGVSDHGLLKNRCQRLVMSFQQFFKNQYQSLPLSCSIGIAVSPQHGITYYDLFQHADQALYQAKARGKNCFVIYEPQSIVLTGYQNISTAVSNHIDSDDEPGLANSSLVHYAFQRLYASRDVAASINEILSIVGKKMNVSRVYVFENSDDNRFCSNTYEWCNEGIPPEINNLQNISYETDIPHYEDNFNEQGIFYCPDIHDLPKRTYDIVAPQGIKSMLHCAIRENGVFRGYIGFD
jgi:diguanylate cyclase (GGDEF)-like protein